VALSRFGLDKKYSESKSDVLNRREIFGSERNGSELKGTLGMVWAVLGCEFLRKVLRVYSGRIGGDSGLRPELPKNIRGYRKIIRGECRVDLFKK
jgi:hypothetical protein